MAEMIQTQIEAMNDTYNAMQVTAMISNISNFCDMLDGGTE
jgi:hypothetical protein